MGQLSAAITIQIFLSRVVEAPGMDDLAITMQWSVPPIRERRHQPISFHFPQREFGQKTVTRRSFQDKWFSK